MSEEADPEIFRQNNLVTVLPSRKEAAALDAKVYPSDSLMLHQEGTIDKIRPEELKHHDMNQTQMEEHRHKPAPSSIAEGTWFSSP